MNDARSELISALLELRETKPLRYWLMAAMIETIKPGGGSSLVGMSKGQYKRIIREGRKLQSCGGPELRDGIEEAITYIRQNMGEWRA